MSELLRSVGHDPLLTLGGRLLTPPLREVYAILMRAGVLVVED
ncbi:hypothetical protein Mycch_2248 [Mycolicibacterium chubuense NBB4]|uniref:Uncharacterized protein n=1 Tax=Mycolicibacterium chubuense (strain NBB4) TaxID=710421 RepID=I4BIB8_MYCCN|nr:Rv1535 domain-containing protein [Mycolicibacterium chubuense]AFM17025.1 hypothetical protein Mycch_2248 [Mycolicibacterium chubuense NBB4]